MAVRKDPLAPKIKRNGGPPVAELRRLLDGNGWNFNVVAKLVGACEMTIRRRMMKSGLYQFREATHKEGRPKGYACKADPRPVLGTQQPLRNPACRFYEDCLDRCDQRVGMNCAGCERFGLRDGVDPVQTYRSYAPMSPLRGPFTRTEVAERPSEKALGM